MPPRKSARLAARSNGQDVTAFASPAASARRTTHKDLICRLQALPSELLRLILRTAGRPTRAVCRLFRHAYGPCPHALLLTSATTSEHVASLRTRRGAPPRSPNVRALLVAPSATRDHLSHTLLCALARAYPTLRSLPLRVHMCPETFAALRPLAATLTHLGTSQLRPPGATALAKALPSLRSLEFWCNNSSLAAIVDTFAGGLPHLVDLKLQCGIDQVYPPASLLLNQLAGGLPHLTRLYLDASLHDWDAEAAATLASAWPQLASLRLEFRTPPQGAGAALAQHTALTHLAITGATIPDWHLLHVLPISDLRLDCSLFRYYYSESVSPVVLAPFSATLTRLVLLGPASLQLDDSWAGPLTQLQDSLLSLDLATNTQCWGHLRHLSCLSRLQDLTLKQHDNWPCEQAVAADQAAADLAGGLSSLRYLKACGIRNYLLQRSLVAGLAVHSQLRELHVSSWDPRWPVRLAGVAGTLARLTFTGSVVPPHVVLLLISSLKGLPRLQWLSFPLAYWGDNVQGQALEPPWMEGSRTRGGRAGAAEPDATAWPEWGALEAGAQAAAGLGGGPGRVWLPPQLKVLQLPAWCMREHKLVGVLRDAGRRQGCRILDEQERPYPYAAQRDDCEGYEAGATTQWLRRHGRL